MPRFVRLLAVVVALQSSVERTAIAGDAATDANPPAGTSAPPRSMADMLALPADNVRDALDSELRSDEDRKRDAYENVEAILRTSGVARGMRVVDLRAADGYFTQILALAVRRNGKTWGNNDPVRTDSAMAAAWDKRLHGPGAADIASIAVASGSPLPPFVTRIDLAFRRGAALDSAARGTDAASHRAVWDVLKPGGRYVVIDARAAASSDAASAAALCRASEQAVRRDVEAAGFRLVTSSDALANAKDTHTKTACSSPDADRFLLVFEKPAQEPAVEKPAEAKP